MRILEHENITSKKKKIILTIILIFGFLFFLLNVGSARAETEVVPCKTFCESTNECGYEISYSEYLCRKIGVSGGHDLCDVCKFDEVDGIARVYNCCCQDDNNVEDCYVGGLFGGDRSAVCLCCGDCTLNDLLYIGVSVAELILKYLGVIALALFVLGGIIWITSGGSKDKVQKGAAIIKGAIIGMIIVIVAFSVVRVIMKDILKVDQVEMPGSIPESSSIEHRIS